MEICFTTIVLWNHEEMNRCVYLHPFPENLSYSLTTNTASLPTAVSREAYSWGPNSVGIFQVQDLVFEQHTPFPFTSPHKSTDLWKFSNYNPKLPHEGLTYPVCTSRIYPHATVLLSGFPCCFTPDNSFSSALFLSGYT